MRAVRPSWRPIAALLMLFGVVASCSVLAGIVHLPEPDLTQEIAARERSYGPEYPTRLPAGEPTRITRATLAPDGRTLTIQFIGGSAYKASNFCSTDYAPWLAPNGDELDVEVVQVGHADQATAPPNTFCALVGYDWTFHLALAAPFKGTTINDLGRGGNFLVGTPPGTANVAEPPFGWTLQAAYQLEAGPPPVWAEVYAAAHVGPRSAEGPGQLVLYQAFGLSSEWTDARAEKSRQRGGAPQAVMLGGKPAQVWFDKESGELLLGWDVGGRSFGLIGNAAEMTVEQLVRSAESVTYPAPLSTLGVPQ